ncbi:MAG: hypothetical protein ACYC7L_16475 [Nitrospirota bacterium]
MVFSYYNKLSAANKRIYEQSDGIISVPLPAAGELQPLIPLLSAALAGEDREQAEEICRRIVMGIAKQLSTPPLRVKVLAVRPSASWGELHGLYEPSEGRASAVISLWMRTAKHRRVVAFRSFLRTLLHELCHHLETMSCTGSRTPFIPKASTSGNRACSTSWSRTRSPGSRPA